MKNFEYFRPTTVRGAIKVLSDGSALPIAGGMDLVPSMQDNIIVPDRVVNLKAIEDEELRGISETEAGIRIGALTTVAEVADDPLLRERYTAVAEAAEEVGSPQIRHAGTIGGNLCQRPRCWYFRNEDYECLKKGGARCFAQEDEADNEYHAIFGRIPCNIVHPSSIAPALVALNAKAHIAGPKGARVVSLDDFFVLPRVRLMAENVLDPGELVTQIEIPTPAPGTRSAYIEVSQKGAFDWAISGAAVAVVMEGPRVQSARVVLHAVAPIPWRATAAERTLVGKALNDGTIRQAAEAALEGAEPLSKNAYKIPLTKTMVRRALGRLV